MLIACRFRKLFVTLHLSCGENFPEVPRTHSQRMTDKNDLNNYSHLLKKQKITEEKNLYQIISEVGFIKKISLNTLSNIDWLCKKQDCISERMTDIIGNDNKYVYVMRLGNQTAVKTAERFLEIQE